jgi:hypothetical protein
MQDVRTILAKSFEALMAISKDHDLKVDNHDDAALNALLDDLSKLNELTGEAMRRAAGHIEVTLYAIGKELAPGEYSGFTHGPSQTAVFRDQPGEELGLEDGDCLVKIIQTGGVVNHVTEAIWMDDQWNETGDELKEMTA